MSILAFHSYYIKDSNFEFTFTQARASGLTKQIGDVQDQIEAARLELSTFTFLKNQETFAVPKRLQVMKRPYT